eukprot:2169505-Amphidinium_carterae.2
MRSRCGMLEHSLPSTMCPSRYFRTGRCKWSPDWYAEYSCFLLPSKSLFLLFPNSDNNAEACSLMPTCTFVHHGEKLLLQAARYTLHCGRIRTLFQYEMNQHTSCQSGSHPSKAHELPVCVSWDKRKCLHCSVLVSCEATRLGCQVPPMCQDADALPHVERTLFTFQPGSTW